MPLGLGPICLHSVKLRTEIGPRSPSESDGVDHGAMIGRSVNSRSRPQPLPSFVGGPVLKQPFAPVSAMQREIFCNACGRVAAWLVRAPGGTGCTFRLVQDAVIRNLQTLAESSQRLSSEIKASEPHIPWRDLGGCRNVIVHGYLGVDLQAVWLVVEQDLPALAEAVHRMDMRLTPRA